jgi:hypothetical protein
MMIDRQTQRRTIALWKIAPLFLVPPAVMAAVSLYFDLAFTPFLYTCALSVTGLLLLVSPHSRLRWALASAVVALGLLFMVAGVNLADIAASAVTWSLFGMSGGM